MINPGGPGGSGVQYALSARSGEFTAAVLSRFDIVGFDPRGVGGSVPALRCMSGPQLDRYFATNDAPATAAQFAAVVSVSKLYAAQCARNAADLLPYVGTVSCGEGSGRAARRTERTRPDIPRQVIRNGTRRLLCSAVSAPGAGPGA